MNILAKARSYLRDDSGAVTVDWVVLTAAVVILSVGAIAAIDGGLGGLIDGIGTSLGTAPLPTTGDAWTAD